MDDLLKVDLFNVLLGHIESHDSLPTETTSKFDIYQEGLIKYLEKSLYENKHKSTISLTINLLKEQLSQVPEEQLEYTDRKKKEYLLNLLNLLDAFPIKDAPNLKKVFNLHKTPSVLERLDKY